MNIRIICKLVIITSMLLGNSARALETDQFYAWGKPIEDSTHYLNAWVRLQIQDVLDSKVNNKPRSCETAVNLIQKRLQHSIYQPIEIWINSTELVDRVPRGVDEYRDYRNSFLLSKTFPLDTARGLLPSPTLQVNEIRIGSDKLAHFFSEGWWYFKWWQKNKADLSADELQHQLLLYGIKLEKWIHGNLLTGVISPADLEANYQGFIFYMQLCDAEKPLLYQNEGHWHFSEAFDIANYVIPKWDESWNTNIYSKKRWKGVRQTMMTYCPMLQNEWVKQHRAYYAEHDEQTPTQTLIEELVAAGELPDPYSFDIIQVCEQASENSLTTP